MIANVVSRMAAVRSLLGHQRYILEAVLRLLVQHPIRPGRSTSERDMTKNLCYTIVTYHPRRHLLQIVFGRAVLKLERWRKSGQSFLELNKGATLVAHLHQLIEPDQLVQSFGFDHVTDVGGLCFAGKPKVEVAKPENVAITNKR